MLKYDGLLSSQPEVMAVWYPPAPALLWGLAVPSVTASCHSHLEIMLKNGEGTLQMSEDSSTAPPEKGLLPQTFIGGLHTSA